MNTDPLNAKILSDHIDAWAQPGNKIVIGIEGYSGSGKTTLVRQLAELRSDILTVNRDDFAIERQRFYDLFAAPDSEKSKIALLRHRTIDAERLSEFLRAYKASDMPVELMLRGEKSGKLDTVRAFNFALPVLVIEGIFLFDNPAIASLLDHKIYMDIDFDVADERRRAREMQKWGDEYYPDTKPDSFSRLIRLRYIDYVGQSDPASRADLVLK